MKGNLPNKRQLFTMHTHCVSSTKECVTNGLIVPIAMRTTRYCVLYNNNMFEIFIFALCFLYFWTILFESMFSCCLVCIVTICLSSTSLYVRIELVALLLHSADRIVICIPKYVTKCSHSFRLYTHTHLHVHIYS